MEAEGFVQQPLASLGVPALAFVVRLVAAAGELFAAAQVHAEAVLLRLRRKYIEEGEFPAYYLALFSVAYRYQVQQLSYEGGLLRAEQLARHVVYKSYDLVVRVDARLAVVCAAAHVLAYHARHPDYAEQVVDVLVRHEYVAYILPVCSGLLQPAQHRVSAAAVDEQMFPLAAQHEAGVVAFGHCRVAGSEHRYFHFCILPPFR